MEQNPWRASLLSQLVGTATTSSGRDSRASPMTSTSGIPNPPRERCATSTTPSPAPPSCSAMDHRNMAYPLTADAALAMLDEGQARWRAGVEGLTDEALRLNCREPGF